MLKLMLWPFVVTLFGLLLVMVFARKENFVSVFAKKIVPSQDSRWQSFVELGLGAVLLGMMIWFAFFSEGRPNASLLVFVATLMSLAVLLVITACYVASELFRDTASLAAEIGETLSDTQKRSALRHGIRWLTRFKKW